MVEHIEEYSHLTSNITKPSDILKSILSILNTVERRALKVHHYTGVPLLPLCPRMLEFPSDNLTLAM